MRILFVEDDFITGQVLQKTLIEAGYICDVISNGEDGIEIGKVYDYDLIILDLILPDMHGIDVMKKLRSLSVNSPILILSGISETNKKVESMLLGADDYMTKPYSKDELIARIAAIIRRSSGYSSPLIKIGNLEINLNTKSAYINGDILKLTSKEYSVLELMALRKGCTLTKEIFLNHLYGGMDEPEMKIVDVFICKLRKKLFNATNGKELIQTVWGRGYMLNDEPEKIDQNVDQKEEEKIDEKEEEKIIQDVKIKNVGNF